jgi:integrase
MRARMSGGVRGGGGDPAPYSIDMRHTCATLLAALDVHPRVAMRILRHAQIDVTMNVYTEVSDAKTLQALKRLGRQLGS